MALALDGSVHKNITSGSSTTVSLTTTAAGVVVAVVTINAVTPGVSSISSSNTSGWALRKRQVSGAATQTIEIWAGASSGALSSETITLNFLGAISFCTIDVFGVSGANTATIWDSNASLPDGGNTAPRTVSTTTANTMLIGAFRFSSTASPTEGTGFTKISGANFQLAEYKIVSATQSSASVLVGTGSADVNGGIGDAIVQASSAFIDNTSNILSCVLGSAA